MVVMWVKSPYLSFLCVCCVYVFNHPTNIGPCKLTANIKDGQGFVLSHTRLTAKNKRNDKLRIDNTLEQTKRLLLLPYSISFYLPFAIYWPNSGNHEDETIWRRVRYFFLLYFFCYLINIIPVHRKRFSDSFYHTKCFW